MGELAFESVSRGPHLLTVFFINGKEKDSYLGHREQIWSSLLWNKVCYHKRCWNFNPSTCECDVIFKWSLCWCSQDQVIKVDPNPIWLVFLRKRVNLVTEIDIRGNAMGRGMQRSGWCFCKPMDTENCQKPPVTWKEAQDSLSLKDLGVWGINNPADTLISEFQPPELRDITFLLSNCPVFNTLLGSSTPPVHGPQQWAKFPFSSSQGQKH